MNNLGWKWGKQRSAKKRWQWVSIILGAFLLGCIVALIWQHKAEATYLQDYFANIPEGQYLLCVEGECDLNDLPNYVR